MMRKIACLLLLALPAFAQSNDAQKPVAVINGETISAQQLDRLYESLSPQMRDQYEKAGGKRAFLDQYIRQRLVIQEAMKSGFDQRPNVKAEMNSARDSALFEAYVRDVIASSIVPESMVRKYYDDHQAQFAVPERRKVRHIVVTAQNTGPHPRTKEQALELMKQIATELHEENTASRNIKDPEAAVRLRVNQFAQLARKYSEDAAAQSGGDLGWVVKDQLDPDFGNAAFMLPAGTPSGIVESKFGYHIIMVEAIQPAGTQPFDEVKTSIRDSLLGEKMADVMTAVAKLTNELRATSKIAVYPENIK